MPAKKQQQQEKKQEKPAPAAKEAPKQEAPAKGGKKGGKNVGAPSCDLPCASQLTRSRSSTDMRATRVATRWPRRHSASASAKTARSWTQPRSAIPAIATGTRHFSFVSKFPTHDESLIADAGDAAPASSRLICGNCSAQVSPTKDLIFFKWKNGIHLSSATEEPLQHLRAKEHWDDASWKRKKLHCLKCDSRIGTMARVYSTDKILFSAREVAIEMPENQSPLVSLSGYPSSMLAFTMWTELILMMEAQPQLKDALQIRRVDRIGEFSPVRKELNRDLLLARDLDSLLKIVETRADEMNHINIITALDRASKLYVAGSARKNRMSARANPLPKSEAPEDQLLDIRSSLALPETEKRTLADNTRFWLLIKLVDDLVNFGIGAVQDGSTLANLMSSLWRLGVGRPSILKPLATQATFILKSPQHEPNAHEASILASGIVHLGSKATRSESWVKELLDAAADVVLKECKNDTKDPKMEIIVALARSFVIANEFHEDLFSMAFQRARAGKVESSGIIPVKVKFLQSKLYQIHVDSLLNGRSPEFQLAPSQIHEYVNAFEEYQKQVRSSSFRAQHLVSKALDDMDIKDHENIYVLPNGYVMDIVLPRLSIGIEINNAESYQTMPRMPAPTDNNAIDVESAHDIPFGFVDMKARHLEQMGWVVVQIPVSSFMKLRTAQARVQYLSMALEVAAYGPRAEQD